MKWTYIESLHDLQVGHVDLGVLGEVGVLLGHHHALLEEVLVDGDAVLLRHQHLARMEETSETFVG